MSFEIIPTTSLLYETMFAVNELLERKGHAKRVDVKEGKLVWCEQKKTKKKREKKS